MKYNTLNISYITVLLAFTSTSYAAGSWSSSGGIIGGDNAQSIAMESLKTTLDDYSKAGMQDKMVGSVADYVDTVKVTPMPAKPVKSDDYSKAGIPGKKAGSVADSGILLIEGMGLKNNPECLKSICDKGKDPEKPLFYSSALVGVNPAHEGEHRNNCPPLCTTTHYPCPLDNSQTCKTKTCVDVTHC